MRPPAPAPVPTVPALLAVVALALGLGCGPADTAAAADLGPVADQAAAPDLATDRSASCASTFGSALIAGFGRLDGTVQAIVDPGDQRCAMPNSTHLVIQVRVGGEAYRMVVNVQSDRAGADVRDRYAELDAPLPAPAFAEGWHLGAALDYVGTLQTHIGAFTPMVASDLVAKVKDPIQIGDPISVYATTSGGSSAHLVHRNLANQDGAIVLHPSSGAPRFLLFAFVEQTF